jgi:hypothetical protein
LFLCSTMYSNNNDLHQSYDAVPEHDHSLQRSNSGPVSMLVPMIVGHCPLHQPESSLRLRSASDATSRQQHCKSYDDKALLYDEMKDMTKLAVPVILTYLLEMLPGLITIILVGRVEYDDENEQQHNSNHEEAISMQKLHIDAAALGVMFLNVVALSPGFGLLTAMDTLCSQAHGANQTTKMGTYSLTGFFILTSVFFLSSVILWNASSVLILLGQPPIVAQLAGEFVRYLLPGLPFVYAYELIRKVSQSRNEAMPMLISSIVCNVVVVCLGYYLVHYTTMGWYGAAVARSVGNAVLVPVIILGMVMGWGGAGMNATQQIEHLDPERLELIAKRTESNQSSSIGEITDDEEGSDEDDKEFLCHILEGFVLSEALSAKALIEFLALGFPGMLQMMFEW